MLLAIAVGVIGGLAGANMAPMWIVVALPLCTPWIAALWAARGVAALSGDSGGGIASGDVRASLRNGAPARVRTPPDTTILPCRRVLDRTQRPCRPNPDLFP